MEILPNVVLCVLLVLGCVFVVFVNGTSSPFRQQSDVVPLLSPKALNNPFGGPASVRDENNVQDVTLAPSVTRSYFDWREPAEIQNALNTDEKPVDVGRHRGETTTTSPRVDTTKSSVKQHNDATTTTTQFGRHTSQKPTRRFEASTTTSLPTSDVVGNVTTVTPKIRHHRDREKKAHLVKKYLRKHKKQEGTIRLVDGRGGFEGNVEVFHQGRWGAVCDDEWDLREAVVVCKQLSFDGAERVTHSSMFGPARRRYWMDNLYCTGDELELGACRFDGWGNSDCTPSEAAGVMCKAAEPATTPKPTAPSTPLKAVIKDSKPGAMKIRLSGGRVPEEGRVEVKVGTHDWGVLCGDGWGLPEALVVCKQLGLGFANDAAQTDFFGTGAGMVMSGVECLGSETSLDECRHDVGPTVCLGPGEPAAAVCSRLVPDLVVDHLEIARTAHLEDRQLYFLQCAMEENCLASSAYKLQRERVSEWHLETRRLLRFTARILNAGNADFRPSIPKHMWEFHQCHMHYHSMEVFATFDVFDSRGVRVAEGHKASFCLEDNQCMPGVEPQYACANFGDQGISVNCSDIYKHNIDCQWVDISDLSPGMFTLKVAVNPEFKVAEMSFANNAAVCNLFYSETYAHVFNCTMQRP